MKKKSRLRICDQPFTVKSVVYDMDFHNVDIYLEPEPISIFYELPLMETTDNRIDEVTELLAPEFVLFNFNKESKDEKIY